MNLVSIIVPCYNYGWVLSESLDSLLAQTYHEWECIIIDDGSTDNTRQVVEEYQARDSRFQYLYQVNAGMSAARNQGIKLAKGEYLQFLDADDLLAPQKLELQSQLLDTHPEVDITYGEVRYFQHGKPAQLSRSFDMLDVPWQEQLNGQGEAIITSLTAHNIIVMNAPLLRSALISRVGPFTSKLRSMEDWEFWLRCALAKAFFHYDGRPAVWSIVRVHPTSTSQNRLRMLFFEQEVRTWLAESLQVANLPEAQAINQRRLDELPRQYAINDVRHGDLKKGLLAYWQLARETGQYVPLAREVFYCLRHRKVSAAVK